MRIVWKDSSAKTEYKPIKYRKHIITGCKGGWTVDIPGDNNIYKNNFCAMNAIDKAYGEEGQRGTEKRKNFGIQIIGKKDNKEIYVQDSFQSVLFCLI